MKNSRNPADSAAETEKYITTGTLARLSGISRDTLIFYIRTGLIQPVYTAKNKYKYFLPEQIQTLNFIRYYRKLDFPLETIKEMLEIHRSGSDNPALPEILKQQKSRLEEKIVSMRRAVDYLDWESSFQNEMYTREPDQPYIKELPEQDFFLTPVPFCRSLNNLDNAKQIAAFFSDGEGAFSLPELPMCCRIQSIKFYHALIQPPSEPDTVFTDPDSGRKRYRRRGGLYGCMITAGSAAQTPEAIDHLIQWLTKRKIPVTGTGIVINSCDFLNITEKQSSRFLIEIELAETGYPSKSGNENE